MASGNADSLGYKMVTQDSNLASTDSGRATSIESARRADSTRRVGQTPAPSTAARSTLRCETAPTATSLPHLAFLRPGSIAAA